MMTNKRAQRRHAAGRHQIVRARALPSSNSSMHACEVRCLLADASSYLLSYKIHLLFLRLHARIFFGHVFLLDESNMQIARKQWLQSLLVRLACQHLLCHQLWTAACADTGHMNFSSYLAGQRQQRPPGRPPPLMPQRKSSRGGYISGSVRSPIQTLNRDLRPVPFLSSLIHPQLKLNVCKSGGNTSITTGQFRTVRWSSTSACCTNVAAV